MQSDLSSIENETIFALSSAPGRAGVAVVRLSGPKSLQILEKLSGKSDFKKGVVRYTAIKHPQDKTLIDRILALWFQGPESYTGEDVVELHCHGSEAVLEELFEVLGNFPFTRIAEPGEFTRRAFENGKMDLTEAEAVHDLINAQTSLQKQAALSNVNGQLSTLYHGWADRLLKLAAYLEAHLDFADEEIDPPNMLEIQDRITTIRDEINTHLLQDTGEKIRDGFNLVITGPPNVGKSTFINLLSQRDIAITSPIAGTTRDIIENFIDIKGYPFRIYDTAGIRNSSKISEIEKIGIDKAQKLYESADVIVVIVDSLNKNFKINKIYQNKTIYAQNKNDIEEKLEDLNITISCQNNDIYQLLEAIINLIKKSVSRETNLLTHARYRKNLQNCANILQSLDATEIELFVANLHEAIFAINKITGKTSKDDLLDIIFQEFCIGK
jgi:tRNA modification GTPase